MYTCEICFDENVQSQAGETSTCPTHSICTTCMKIYLEGCIRARDSVPLHCPGTDCTIELSDAVVASCLGNTSRPYQQYLELRHQYTSVPPASARMCVSCGACELDPENPRWTCKSCRTEHCYICTVPWTELHSCAENLKRERLFQSYLKEHQHAIRQCFHCRAQVLHVEGCNKMRCRCGAKWCFACGSRDAKCKCTGSGHVFHSTAEVHNNWVSYGGLQGDMSSARRKSESTCCTVM